MAAKVTKAGLLGSAVLNEFGDVATPYTVPANSKAAVTLTLCNGSDKVQRVRAGYAVDGAAPNATRWLLGGARGFDLPAGGTEQVTTMLGAGQGAAFKGPIGSAEVSCTVNGQEETL